MSRKRFRQFCTPVLGVLLVFFMLPAKASPGEMIPLLEQSIKLQTSLLTSATESVTRIPPGPALKTGSSGTRVKLLNSRLKELGHLAGEAGNSFQADTEAAVRAYQESAGLVVDGVVDHQTRFSLNLSQEDKIDILRAQLEEMERFYKDNQEQRYIIVNVPSYSLRAYDGEQRVLESRVVVGGAARRTPLMKTNLTGIVLHPTWSPPKTILAKDIFRSGEIHTKTVQKMGLRLVDAQGKTVEMDEAQIQTQEDLKNGGYRFVQPAGERNALGLLKFVLDNRLDIYMHDTNHRELFERQSRAFSSGCIRVERFRELAAWVTGKSVDEINQELQKPRTRRLAVEKLPVFIVYWPAEVNQGKLVFSRDIYSRIRLKKKPQLQASTGKKLTVAP